VHLVRGRARPSPACLGSKGSQGRALPARRGSPLLPGIQLLSTTMGMDRQQAVLVAFLWSNTADLTVVEDTSY
jgi:hypothetical protein